MFYSVVLDIKFSFKKSNVFLKNCVAEKLFFTLRIVNMEYQKIYLLDNHIFSVSELKVIGI